jgi:hypothetical protein
MVGFTAAVLIAVAFPGRPATAVELPRIVDDVRSFAASPRVSNDALPPSVRGFADRVTERAGYGRAMADEVRLFASGLGRNASDAYAFPTTGGALCILVDEATYAATCVPRFHRRFGYLAWGIYSGVGAPQTLYGVVSNKVHQVKVIVSDTEVDAELRGNLLFWQAPVDVTREEIQGIMITLRDGSTVSVDL